MKLFVVGANGLTGSQVVHQALADGHIVTAFVRNPGSLPVENKNLKIVTGNVTTDTDSLTQVLKGHDGVISALGVNSNPKGRRYPHVMVPALSNLITAMRNSNIQRIVILSGFGVGETLEKAPLFLRTMSRIMSKTAMGKVGKDMNDAENLIVSSGLEWTIAFPVALSNGSLTKNYSATKSLDFPQRPLISRADVAHFMLHEVIERKFVRSRAVLNGAG